MIPVTDGLLGEMVQAIVDEVDPEQVILFGSRARGDEREDSDVDLLVARGAQGGEGAPAGSARGRPVRDDRGRERRRPTCGNIGIRGRGSATRRPQAYRPRLLGKQGCARSRGGPPTAETEERGMRREEPRCE